MDTGPLGSPPNRRRGSTSDFLKDLVDRAQSGFVAWLAVDPEYRELGLGRRLLRRVCREMERRGYRDTLLSWEMRDGVLNEDSLSPDAGEVVERIGYQIYRRRA